MTTALPLRMGCGFALRNQAALHDNGYSAFHGTPSRPSQIPTTMSDSTFVIFDMYDVAFNVKVTRRRSRPLIMSFALDYHVGQNICDF
jgi:hypothetical protein